MERWQQIESLFQEALQHPVEERDSWLREACATDAELHREVVSLLGNHHASDSAGPWAAAAAQLIVKPVLLEPGQLLGPYQIVSFLAAGGMGEVYRARDTRLKRDVAVKVLPEAFARDSGRMARLQREAEVLAALNHPNIAQIYGAEESALAMELVDGPTLGDLIRQGAIPPGDALEISRQIAEALEAAHEKGIVHRDLKPANVKITPEGEVKVLDFGLAKAIHPDSSANIDELPTATLDSTETGVVMGTAAYMSPEQARGQAVDRRTDIWAFGCVLYELLARRRVFLGGTTSDVLAAVLTQQPDWGAIPPSVAPNIVTLLQRCLQSD